MKKKQDVKPNTKPKNHCKICNKIVVGGSYKFKSHLYQHRAVRPRFKCSYCTKEYYRRDAFQKHLAKHTGNYRKVHICDYCERSFVDKRNLISHLKIHDDFFIKPKLKFRCMACGTCYCEERLLKYHIRKTHFNLQPNEPLHLKKLPNDTWVERVNKSDVCVQMTKVNNNILTIKKCDTIKKETNKKDKHSQFNDYISSIFANKDKSQYSKAICDYCNKEMLKKSLYPHIRERHWKLKRFQCDICKENFSRHYQMVNHNCGMKGKRRKQMKNEHTIKDDVMVKQDPTVS